MIVALAVTGSPPRFTNRKVERAMSESENRVREIIAEKLELDINEVTPEAKFIDDLGADSLMIAKLVMAMEDEFHIEILDEDSEKILRVQDVYDYLHEKLDD